MRVNLPFSGCVKVRILGYHPYSVVELPNKDLPWAQCLLSTTAGSGARNQATSVKVAPGDTVFGFFLDGDNAQVPVIIGLFGRTNQVPSNEFLSPFVPFTGKTDRIKNDLCDENVPNLSFFSMSLFCVVVYDIICLSSS